MKTSKQRLEQFEQQVTALTSVLFFSLFFFCLYVLLL
jgi:hypothetical protein